MSLALFTAAQRTRHNVSESLTASLRDAGLNPDVLPGIIIARYGVNAQGRGPGSGISYDVAVEDPRGAFIMPNAKPLQRWPDTVDTVAAPIRAPVTVYRIGHVLVCDIPEFPAVSECPPTP